MAHPGKHHLGVVTYPSETVVCVLDLPGCLTAGRILDEAAGTLPLVIGEHIAWLQGHGEAIEALAGWEVSEQVDAGEFQPMGGEFCFEADRAPLNRRDLEKALARVAYAHADLLESVRALPDAVLDWAPPPSTVDAFDPWAPDVRTVRDIVRHVLQLEAHYREGLRDGPAAGIFEAVDAPHVEQARTIERLRSLGDADLSRVFRPTRPSRAVPDEWTVRKALRRLISHARAHTAEVLQRRTWVLLGVPSAPMSDPRGGG